MDDPGVTALLGGVAAVAVPLVLLGSFVGHLRRPGLLTAALRAQRVLPRPLAAPLAGLVLLAEAALGGMAATGALQGRTDLARGSLAAAAALLAAYGLYGAYVTRARPGGVPCGCAGDLTTPMTGWVAARAGLLALLALPGAVWGPPGDAGAVEITVTAAAGAAFALILWTLPQAMIYERSAAG
ncbi:MauE/DoxX family redox-associated membrane protein [Spirillospora sp. NPDC047279]|uniref:MauE/DoxX family redox-associated membrane protein n=1 Tax=Spirillospora sp. NPDC047279 TaxID=3155478 RepID=UPI0033DDA525